MTFSTAIRVASQDEVFCGHGSGLDRALAKTLLAFSVLISEDSWAFLFFLSDRIVFIPSDRCAEILRSLGESRKNRNPRGKG